MQLNRLFGHPAIVGASGDDATDDFWYGPIGRRSTAGVNVTVAKALTLPVVYAAVQVLSQTIGSLPWGVFERGKDGSKKRTDEHPLVSVLRDPNEETNDVEFLGQMVFDLATEGNFYAEIREGRLGPVSELWRLEPSRVLVERLPDGSKRYTVAHEHGRQERLGADDVWHVKVFPHCDGGLRGLAPIHTGSEIIGAAIAVQDYAARFFENDATPPFVIKAKSNFKDENSRNNFLGAIKRWWGGKRRHSPALLENGMELEKVGITNDEAQFLETKAKLDEGLARLWRMPPHKVGILDRSTNNNIEHQSLEFVMDTLLPWLRLVEKSILKHLIIADRRYFFEFNVAGLLRGDLKARYEAYSRGRQWGWLSVNEIRNLENMNPVAGGDQYMTPLNMVPVGEVDDRDRDREARNARTVFGPSGEVLSQIVNGNIVRMEHYRNAA